jgi:DNA polymerase-3 subunit epsilon
MDNNRYKNKIWVIDIETTWLDTNTWLIVEIGIVSLDLETWKIEEEFNSIVKEDWFDISHTKWGLWWIFKNTDLTFDDVDNAISLKSKLNEIQYILDKFTLWVTAYNKAFDFLFLKSRWLKIKNELSCPMMVATPLVNLEPNEWYTDPKRPKVEEARDYFIWTEYEELHRACDDASHEAQIVYELYKRWKFIINNMNI